MTPTPARTSPQKITLHVDTQQLSSWSSVGRRWLLGTGTRTLFVGSSSRTPKQQTTVTVR